MTEVVGPRNYGTERTSQSIISLNNYLSAFPLQNIRPNQRSVLQEICDSFNNGYKFIVLEAPTGFGKSPVAMCIARTLGSSYICSATKELQTQYVYDFPWLRIVKGMNNFTCLVGEDFTLSNNYRCEECGPAVRYDECMHKSVSYGPCRTGQLGYAHTRNECPKCISGVDSKFHDGCRYKTYQEDYKISKRNTIYENVFIDELRLDEYKKWYKSTSFINTAGNAGYIWTHLNNLEKDEIREFIPCPYYDQRNKGLVASHSIFNYANFLLFLGMKILPKRELLILDEGHQIEDQIIKHLGISITRRTLQKFIPTDLLDDITLDYASKIEDWIKLLVDLDQLILNSTSTIRSKTVMMEAEAYLQRLNLLIEAITLCPKNWIVTDIQREGIGTVDSNKIKKIEFKPLDVSPYCKWLLEKCSRTLIMSATILDIDTFCRNIGLDRIKVKFIQADSDFPLENRPIYQMDIARLNFNSIRLETTQRMIANAVDMIMLIHKKDKGIIHTTSYEQIRFIQKYISNDNRIRLIYTDPERPREEVTSEHFKSTRPTVLISPSLHTGLDLKNQRSRFQILIKVPYPSKGDKWINAKMRRDSLWYNWQTGMKMIQAYGRSVRSKDDWAKTYVLDSYFREFVNRNVLPDWFTKAIRPAKLVDIIGISGFT